MKDKHKEYLEKIHLLNEVDEELEKVLENENPEKQTISRKFGDKTVNVTIEIEDKDEPKGIL